MKKLIKLPFGTIDIEKTTIPKTLRYKVGDKLVILPEWDGRLLNDEELIELHKNGEIGEVTSLNNSYYILGPKSDGKAHCDNITIKTKDNVFSCNVIYYRLGFKLIT